MGWVMLKLPCHLSLSHGACLRLDLDLVTGPFCVAPLWQGWNTPPAGHTSLIQFVHALCPLRSSAVRGEPRRVEGRASDALTGSLLNSSEGDLTPPVRDVGHVSLLVRF